MRAGRYAVVGGVTYQAYFSASSPTVGLIVRGDRPSEDFAWDDRMGGRWYRSVRRDVCSRLFDVATSAYWRGQFPVSVERVDPENARAQINYFPGTVGPPVLGPGGAHLEPALPVDHGRGWSGMVPQSELSGAVEVEHEIPSEPAAAPAVRPAPPRLPPLRP